jgi:hypothetical protein
MSWRAAMRVAVCASPCGRTRVTRTRSGGGPEVLTAGEQYLGAAEEGKGFMSRLSRVGRAVARTVIRAGQIAVVGLVALAPVGVASAQIGPLPIFQPFKYTQKWINPLAGHLSVVDSCQGNQVTWAPVAFDDWICTKSGPIVRLQWWGESLSPNQQPIKYFYVRIWSNGAAACLPAQPLYTACLEAKAQPAGTSCRNRRVYLYSAVLPQPYFSQVQGTHYWLQISEVDRTGPVAGIPASPVIGAPDFAWAAHRNIKNCNAVQRNAAGGIVSPLLNPCDNIEDDLAFRLGSWVLVGHLTPAPLHRGPFIMQLHDSQTGELVDTQCFMPFADGSYEVEPDCPDGVYDIYILGGSSHGLLLPAVQMGDGSVIPLPDANLVLGDADGDGDSDFDDITRVLAGWIVPCVMPPADEGFVGPVEDVTPANDSAVSPE